MVESMQQSSATPSLHLGFLGLRKIVACSQPYLAVASCTYSFWHGVIPTSYFIFNDFYTFSSITRNALCVSYIYRAQFTHCMKLNCTYIKLKESLGTRSSSLCISTPIEIEALPHCTEWHERVHSYVVLVTHTNTIPSIDSLCCIM